jgi:hypothetical protein
MKLSPAAVFWTIMAALVALQLASIVGQYLI